MTLTSTETKMATPGHNTHAYRQERGHRCLRKVLLVSEDGQDNHSSQKCRSIPRDVPY